MRKPVYLLLATVAAAAGLLAYFAMDASEGQAGGSANIASAFGVVERPGGDLIVHVAVLVPDGVPTQRAIDAALGAQGARPATPNDLQSDNFELTGLYWDQFGDANPGNDFVVQNYNPSNEPLDGETVLLNTHNTWNSVATSSFVFSYGGTTTRCPSLVSECSGPQTFDGFNDVTYMNLSGPCNLVFGCTLGVTWSGTSTDEADMGLNTKAIWVHDCSSPGNDIDAESVTLHENGHALGLDHSGVPGAVMQAFYGGANCALHQDDVDGISFLYPAGPPGPTPTTTPTPTVTNTPDGAAPTATATPSDSGPGCPPGHQRRGICTPTP